MVVPSSATAKLTDCRRLTFTPAGVVSDPTSGSGGEDQLYFWGVTVPRDHLKSSSEVPILTGRLTALVWWADEQRCWGGFVARTVGCR